MKRLAVSASFLVILALVSWLAKKNAATRAARATQTSAGAQAASGSSDVEAVIASPKREPASSAPQAPGKKAEAKSQDSKQTMDAHTSAPIAFAKELREYMRLKSKVFMTDDDKRVREQLLRDPSIVRGIGEILERPAQVASEEFDLQNRAIDFLFEALATPSAGEAAEALRTVIADDRVENESVDISSRRALAGIKAEVMYKWSAEDKDRARQIPGWLPGPVSKKIWRNVLEAQEQNMNESAQEIK